MPVHAFFFADAVCLLVTALCFIRISRHFAVRTVAASAVFAFSTVFNGVIIEQFVIPWSTTPSCATIYIILTLFLNRTANSLKFFLTGLLASVVLIIRPTDVISTAPIFIFLAANAAIDLFGAPATAAIPMVFSGHPCLPDRGRPDRTFRASFWSIMRSMAGPFPLISPISQDIGFIFSALPIKLYVLFIDPTALYGQGTAILKALSLDIPVADRDRLLPAGKVASFHSRRLRPVPYLLLCLLCGLAADQYLALQTYPLSEMDIPSSRPFCLGGGEERPVRPPDHVAAAAAAGLFCLLSVRIDLERVDAVAGAASPAGFQASFADMGEIAAIDIPMTGGASTGWTTGR